MTAGVPQGSVLSPLLFNIFVHDLPNPYNTLTAQYADDTAYLYRGKHLPFMTDKIQAALNELEEWTDEWRISINAEKSQAILFTLSRKTPTKNLTYGGTPIPWVNQVKYLGLQMDKRLTWSHHVQSAITKANQAFGQLKSLLITSSNLSLACKIHIYKAMIRAKLTYGCPSWIHISKTQMNRLEIAQSRMLRRITGSPRYVSNARIRSDTKVPKLEVFIRQLAVAHSSKFDVTLLSDTSEIPENFKTRKKRPIQPPLPLPDN